MDLETLVNERNIAYRKICEYVSEQIGLVMMSGEHMAECATNIKGQGYSQFISSREAFLDQARSLQKEIDTLNMSTH